MGVGKQETQEQESLDLRSLPKAECEPNWFPTPSGWSRDLVAGKGLLLLEKCDITNIPPKEICTKESG